jgi:hypothetical protein
MQDSRVTNLLACGLLTAYERVSPTKGYACLKKKRYRESAAIDVHGAVMKAVDGDKWGQWGRLMIECTRPGYACKRMSGAMAHRIYKKNHYRNYVGLNFY